MLSFDSIISWRYGGRRRVLALVGDDWPEPTSFIKIIIGAAIAPRAVGAGRGGTRFGGDGTSA